MNQCMQSVNKNHCIQMVFTSLCYVASLDHAEHKLGAIFVQDLHKGSEGYRKSQIKNCRASLTVLCIHFFSLKICIRASFCGISLHACGPLLMSKEYQR